MPHRMISILVIAFLISACDNNSVLEKDIEIVEEEVSPKKPNIILIVGDGTGLSQLSTLWYFGNEKPNYERFENVGLSKTNSSSHKITDSGAGATAFAIGEKSYNGSIGVDKDSLPKENIVEILSKQGYKTGVISTSSITHATPASFYAHVKNRRDAEEIALQLTNSEIDFFAGGGTKYFTKRADERNLLNELSEKGFTTDTNSMETELTGDKLGYLLASDGMKKMTEGRGDFLKQATEKGIDFLKKGDSPFFLMIEGSQVDWGGHDNDMEYIITELKDLDEAVGVALDYCETNNNTIVIALADHETGGFALSPKVVKGFGGTNQDDDNTIVEGYTTTGHTAAHIPVFANGYKAEVFKGIYENNLVFNKILEVVGE